MPNDYMGSFAQQYVHFTTLQVIQSNPGAAYGQAMLFIDSTSISGLWVGTPPAAGEDFELTADNYQDLTTGELLTILTAYFASNRIASMFVTAWDSGQSAYAGLSSAYSATKFDAYFKTMYLGGLGSESVQNAAAVKLAELAFADTGVYSQVGFGNHAADTLTAISGSLVYGIQHSNGDAVVVYSDATDDTDPWIDQLGLTLGALNATGTSIGNTLDLIATSDRAASGADGVNLSAANVAALVANNVGFWMTLGNSVGQATLVNPKTVKGAVFGADWLVGYIDFAASVKTAEFLTAPDTPQGKRLNNSNYQAILGILGSVAQPFTDKGGIGVLENFTTAVAPPFSQLSPSGTVLTVPHAWSADYLQGIHEVNVQGTLYIQA